MLVKPIDISVVVPVYNEYESLPELEQWIDRVMKANKFSYQLILIDDGSSDESWEVIEQLIEKNDSVLGLRFRRNYGKSAALHTGFKAANGEVVVTMDADLQDDINAIDGFLEKRAEGCDIVYGVRSSREKDTAFKRGTAQGYYKILAKMGVEITYNHADYRLMSKRAVEGLAEFKEVNLFLRGLVPMVGYKSDIVTYVRAERQAGESKYPLKKMISFAMEGITSLSVKPISFITALGVIVFLISLIILIGSIIAGNSASMTIIMASIWALGGLQLAAIGIIGEYIGKIYLESKARPKFIIETNLEEI